ncbi:hypothetical protein PAPYR_1421 [Paratrimastix pyriformis]|uniref:DUF1761 domain-containing protein n=1 Tax=Paratrimastix pyriformis TaxID=342808 RepID=A0ABQ8UUW3_9EUKA|nr:hypothetical protein PAPYR_1421 [Paratrimastix pyriformis]
MTKFGFAFRSLVAFALVQFAGILYYSEWFMGHTWLSLQKGHMTPQELQESTNFLPAMVAGMCGNVILISVWGATIYQARPTSRSAAIGLSLIAWLGLSAAPALSHYMYDQKGLELWVVDFGSTAIQFVIVGLCFFRKRPPVAAPATSKSE